MNLKQMNDFDLLKDHIIMATLKPHLFNYTMHSIEVGFRFAVSFLGGISVTNRRILVVNRRTETVDAKFTYSIFFLN